MKTNIPPQSKPSSGYALFLTLLFLAVALAAFASIMHWVSSSTLVTERNNLHVSAQAAAESATENVMTTMMRDFTYGSLNPVSTYNSLVPDTTGWPNQFAFADTNGLANRTSVNIGAGSWTELPSQFSGLYGYGQDCVIASTAEHGRGNVTTCPAPCPSRSGLEASRCFSSPFFTTWTWKSIPAPQ